MELFVIWLRETVISQWLQDQAGWLWPVAESFHFVGLVLVIGCAGFFDLRLMGFMRRRVSLEAARGFVVFAKFGLTISLITGLIFFVSEPQQYVVKSAWWAKVAFLFVALLNAIVFELFLGKRAEARPAGNETPFAFKVAGFVSLVSWFAVLYFGRMLPYLDPSLNSNL